MQTYQILESYWQLYLKIQALLQDLPPLQGTARIRRRAQAVVDLYEQGTLLEELGKLPKMLLGGEKPIYRDSIYREREILKQRIKVYLNLNIYKVGDMELYELLDLLKKKFNGEKIPAEYEGRDHAVEVIEEACDQCPTGQYYATDLCRNCIAHSCEVICPKDAITFSNERAIIDAEKCIGCGL